jgi:hypothetical protein
MMVSTTLHEERKTIADTLAILDGLNENTAPDEMASVVDGFVEQAKSLNAIDLGIAKSEATDKLKSLNIKGASFLIKQAFNEAKESKDVLQGKGLTFEDLEAWPEEVDGGKLLNDIVSITDRHIVCHYNEKVTEALWILHSWAFDACNISPFLYLTSPEKRCGKSLNLDVIRLLVPKPLSASNCTGSVMFRAIETWRPTLVLDEADTFLKNSDDLAGILNASHRKTGAFVLRAVGENHEPREFSVWCPKVIAGIGKQRDTFEDRSIKIQMRRKTKDEVVERLDYTKLEKELVPVKRKCHRWANDNMEKLRDSSPIVLEGLNDRAFDNWQPLLAIADLCGGEWPELAKKAAVELSGGEAGDDDSIRVRLLKDIQSYFNENKADKISTDQLEKYLNGLEDSPWPEYWQGHPISKTRISRLLSPFGLKSKTIRIDSEKTAKGYLFEEFKDSFSRYLSNNGAQSVTGYTSLNNNGLEEKQNVTKDPVLPFETGVIPLENNNVSSVTFSEGGIDEKEYFNERPSYENGWSKRFFEDEYGKSKAVWEKDGLVVPACTKNKLE